MKVYYVTVVDFVGDCYSTNHKYKDDGKTDSFLVRRDQESDYHVANCLVGNEWTARRGDASEFWLQWKVVVRQRNIMTEIISYRSTKHVIVLSLHCVDNVLHDNERSQALALAAGFSPPPFSFSCRTLGAK